MRLPRDVSGRELAQQLKELGYEVTRETGSHILLTTMQSGEHHVTIPDHNAHRLGTLASILTEVGNHVNMDRSALTERLFGNR